MTTQDERTERRLELEARTVRLGTIDTTDGNTAYDACRVEVTYQPSGAELEHAGYFLVRTPENPAYAELDEYEQQAQHPAELASALVLEELERRYPDADYLSVDDTFAA